MYLLIPPLYEENLFIGKQEFHIKCKGLNDTLEMSVYFIQDTEFRGTLYHIPLHRSRHCGGALSTSSSPSLFVGPASASLLFLPGCMIKNLSSILKPASFASIAWLAPDPCSFGVGDEVAEHRRATMKMTAIMTSFMILPPLLWTTPM